MRVIITGDRNWYAPDLAEQVVSRLLAKYGPNIVIVHGGAGGIDRSFAEACGESDIPQDVHPARWEELDHPQALIRHNSKGQAYNAKAGPIRNGEMVAAGAAMCVAFHQNIRASKGTKDCARQAIEAGIPTYLVDSDQGVPRRIKVGDKRLN